MLALGRSTEVAVVALSSAAAPVCPVAPDPMVGSMGSMDTGGGAAEVEDDLT